VAIAADESVRNLHQLEEVLRRDAADVVVLKPMLVGGPIMALEMARVCGQHGTPVLVTHALESDVGRAGSVHVAAALAGVCERRVCGVSSGAWCQPTVVVPDEPGLGLTLEGMA
jgi:L-alanine-DL-glutamate epimerase-like enolase superfamily enzyme